MSGEHYQPHVTVGVAKEDFVKSLIAESYTPVMGTVAGAAICHVGVSLSNAGEAASRVLFRTLLVLSKTEETRVLASE